MKRLAVAATICTTLVIAGCGAEAGPTVPNSALAVGLDRGATPFVLPQGPSSLASAVAEALDGSGVALAKMEYLTDPASGEMGQTVYFHVRGDKRLRHDFVPEDAYREWGDGIAMTYVIDNEGATSSGLTRSTTEAAIARAMNTWDALTCSDLSLSGTPVPLDLGIVQWSVGMGGSTEYIADIMHAGWLPGAFFDLVRENGSTFVLGVTFTFVWVDENGDPLDMDNNGREDVAFREIYYNDAFTWADGDHIDVETVVLHETGHGFSQEHFGMAFRTVANGQLHFAPLAVMNPAYSGIQTDLTDTDVGGHCTIWGAWPEE